MNKENYMRKLEQMIVEQKAQGKTPTLLLHACCAPCSSYCLEYLRESFRITVFYYNPNISERAEYEKRKAEELRLIREYNREVEEEDFDGMHSTKDARKIAVLECPYDGERYEQKVKGLEDCPERGERCHVCFALRLGTTAQEAAKRNFDYFSTTLTISPLKDAECINTIGEHMGEKYGVAWLPSDFKKKGGYQRSIELSRKFGLYRQNYCGCCFSKEQRKDKTKSAMYQNAV